MKDLAEAVRKVVEPSAVISRAEFDGSPPDRYVGDGDLYHTLMRRYGVIEDSLPQQIRDTAEYLSELTLRNS